MLSNVPSASFPAQKKNKQELPKSSKKAGARPCHSRMAIPLFSILYPRRHIAGTHHMQGPPSDPHRIRASVASRTPHVRDSRSGSHPCPCPTRRGIINMLSRTRRKKKKQLTRRWQMGPAGKAQARPRCGTRIRPWRPGAHAAAARAGAAARLVGKNNKSEGEAWVKRGHQ